jgi:hypothetical protein
MPQSRALIVLQENSGRTPLDDSLPPAVRDLVQTMIDGLTERFEDLKLTLQADGRYDVVHLLTDNACSREKLLTALVDETRKDRIIDLVIIGHGAPERLILKVPPHLEGDAGARTIAELLPDAQQRGVAKLNLRMVYMCNCHAATVHDDWLAIGARVSIGSKALDMMPEPMTTFFINNWLAGQKARDAARNAYEATIPFYLPFYPPSTRTRYETIEVSYPCPSLENPRKMCKTTRQVPTGVELVPHTYVKQTELIVAGDENLTF